MTQWAQTCKRSPALKETQNDYNPCSHLVSDRFTCLCCLCFTLLCVFFVTLYFSFLFMVILQYFVSLRGYFSLWGHFVSHCDVLFCHCHGDTQKLGQVVNSDLALWFSQVPLVSRTMKCQSYWSNEVCLQIVEDKHCNHDILGTIQQTQYKLWATDFSCSKDDPTSCLCFYFM